MVAVFFETTDCCLTTSSITRGVDVKKKTGTWKEFAHAGDGQLFYFTLFYL
jgi:hypothetical protein